MWGAIAQRIAPTPVELLVPLDHRKLATPSIDHAAASDAKFSGGRTTARYERFVLCIVKRRRKRERKAMLQCTLFAVSVRQSKKTVRIVIRNCKRGEAEPPPFNLWFAYQPTFVPEILPRFVVRGVEFDAGG